MPKTKPHRLFERRFHKLGKTLVAGVDEAGRGAWAGPLVAGAVILDETFEPRGVNDSKTLTKKQREHLFVHITRHAVSWAAAVVSPIEVDRMGMTKANRHALEQVVRRLHRRPHAVLVDAMEINAGRLPVKAIIRGDAKSLSIAAASIVAKVVRDALMDGEHRLYPQYGFNIHKGYGTTAHQRAIKVHGPCTIHRQSFAPIQPPVKKPKPKKKPARRKITRLFRSTKRR